VKDAGRAKSAGNIAGRSSGKICLSAAGRTSARTAGRWRCTTRVMARVWKSCSSSIGFSTAYPSSRYDFTVAGEVASSVGEGACSCSMILRLYGGGDDGGLDTLLVSFDPRNQRCSMYLSSVAYSRPPRDSALYYPTPAQRRSSLRVGRTWSNSHQPGSQSASPCP
jgi:hypothetical protein